MHEAIFFYPLLWEKTELWKEIAFRTEYGFYD